jgi:hypothetical protein
MVSFTLAEARKDDCVFRRLHISQQVPGVGKVRITIDWTIEDDQHLLVVSLVIGRRAIPIHWRASQSIGISAGRNVKQLDSGLVRK